MKEHSEDVTLELGEDGEAVGGTVADEFCDEELRLHVSECQTLTMKLTYFRVLVLRERLIPALELASHLVSFCLTTRFDDLDIPQLRKAKGHGKTGAHRLENSRAIVFHDNIRPALHSLH